MVKIKLNDEGIEVLDIVDEIISTENDNYDAFFREQYIINLDIGDKVEIKIEPQDGSNEIKKEFIAKYANCHVNCQWQDKGEKITKLEEK